MFKIGDFSRLSQVSVKALRHYDELGLLKPAYVDRFTGYRYYTAEQLPRLNRILALKDLGFPLAQLARLLEDEMSPAQIWGMLQLRQAELQQHIEAEQARLMRVAARLRQLEQEGTMANYDVVLKRVESMTVVAMRKQVPTYHDVGSLFEELWSQVKDIVQPTGPALAIYHDTEYRERDVDVEAALPVAPTQASGAEWRVYELPGAETMASVIRQGPYDDFTPAYNALMRWIEENGYTITGQNREIYLQGPESGVDPSSFVTEIQFPVKKV